MDSTHLVGVISHQKFTINKTKLLSTKFLKSTSKIFVKCPDKQNKPDA